MRYLGGRRDGAFGQQGGDTRQRIRVLQAEPGGGLHEGVGYQNPYGAQMAAYAHHDGRKEVRLPADPVPAPQRDRQKRGLHKERENRLYCERASEHVADESRVDRPVRPELKHHHYPRHHPYGEYHSEELQKELRRRQVFFVARPEPHGLYYDYVQGESYRNRREQKMEARRQRELQSAENFNVHEFQLSPFVKKFNF